LSVHHSTTPNPSLSSSQPFYLPIDELPKYW
jgi:hypothetical protein